MIWGLTAAILIAVAKVAYRQESAFQEDANEDEDGDDNDEDCSTYASRAKIAEKRRRKT